MPKIQIEELVNKKIGMLIIIGEADSVYRPNGNKERRLKCICDCGKITNVSWGDLFRKSTIPRHRATHSCGCLRDNRLKIHGKSKESLYNVYKSMKSRCYNKNNRAYKNYGERGITICKEWLNNFVDFYSWSIDNNYSKGLTIDRINNDGNYEPGNCRFVTKKENGRNTRWLKIKMSIAWDIRNAYNLGCFTMREIADAYRLSVTHVCDIINNKVWI